MAHCTYFALTAKESANSTLNEPVVPQPVQIAPVPAIKQNIVDISTYAADPSLYLNKQVSFLSYLKHEIRGNENNSVNSYFALDDAGRKLELSSISADERMHFPYNSTSNTVYNVTGVIRKTAKGYAVTVASLAVQ